MKRDLRNQRFIHDIPFRTMVPGIIGWVVSQFNLTGIRVYTYGSKMGSTTGAAIYSREPDIELSFSLCEFAIVFQTDVFKQDPIHY